MKALTQSGFEHPDNKLSTALVPEDFLALAVIHAGKFAEPIRATERVEQHLDIVVIQVGNGYFRNIELRQLVRNVEALQF